MPDECVHGMNPAWCAICRRLPDPIADAPATGRDLDGSPGPWFEAKFRSRCACGEDIHPRQEIRADGQGGYMGRCCEGGDE